MKKLPERLKIGGHWYEISQVANLEYERGMRADISHIPKIIQIDAAAPTGDSRTSEILLHEIIHGVNWVYNDNALDEETVSRLTEGLYQVFRDNELYFGDDE